METQGLPDDMLVEITQRCSTTETLATLRATSKSLALATYESKFTPLNLKSGFLVQTMVSNKYVIQYVPAADGGIVSTSQKPGLLDFLPLKVKINACSDALGLFYCESQQPVHHRGPKNHYVFKLITKEWIQIPNPKTKGDNFIAVSGLVVMKANPIKYKIVRLNKASKLNRRTGFANHTCQIYDSEKPNKWRTPEKDVCLSEDHREWVNPNTSMVTVNGNLHLLVGPKRILVFDSLTDEWNFIPTPKEYPNLHPKIFNDQGKLNFIVENSTRDTLTLWIMEDYKNKIWTRSCEICTQPVLNIVPLASIDHIMNYEKGVFTAHYVIIDYHFRDGSYNRQTLEKHADLIFRFQSDSKKIGWESCADNKVYFQRQYENRRAYQTQNQSRPFACLSSIDDRS